MDRLINSFMDGFMKALSRGHFMDDGVVVVDDGDGDGRNGCGVCGCVAVVVVCGERRILSASFS
jgi:hypothetical protein